MSHSNKEKAIAGKLKVELEEFGFSVFLAHEDIIGGEKWLSVVSREIKDCNTFVVLLSKEYHRAEFTDHELGIAYAMKKPIIPFSIDGTLPYGFMKDYQWVNASSGMNSDKIEELAHSIYLRLKDGYNILDLMINALSNSESHSQANKRANVLFNYQEFFKRSHVNQIANAFLENVQVHGTFRARSMIMDLFNNREEDLTLENRKFLENQKRTSKV